MTLKLYSLQELVFEDLSQDRVPALLRTWQGNSLQLSAPSTHVGFVYQGQPLLNRLAGNGSDGAQQSYGLQGGMYFCLPEAGTIGDENSAGIVITCPNYCGMFSLGGPIEPTGRLAYINGGTSSLLIPPVMLGDPCLNAMYFPPGTDQTLHTHPSYRIGIVAAGEGEIETPETVARVSAGTIFLIPANHLHKFRTGKAPLTLAVFHPDSDAGFTHRDNPMLRRTVVDGISAADLPQIQTKPEETVRIIR